MGFMEHLDALRAHLWRSVVVIFVLMLVLFSQKAWVFDTVLLGPKNPDFISYRWLCSLGNALGQGQTWCVEAMPLQLVNLDLTGQLMQHLYVSFFGAVVLGFPYLVWETWRFFEPCLEGSRVFCGPQVAFGGDDLVFWRLCLRLFCVGPHEYFVFEQLQCEQSGDQYRESGFLCFDADHDSSHSRCDF